MMFWLEEEGVNNKYIISALGVAFDTLVGIVFAVCTWYILAMLMPDTNLTLRAIVSDIVLLLVGFVAGMKSIKKRRKKS